MTAYAHQAKLTIIHAERRISKLQDEYYGYALPADVEAEIERLENLIIEAEAVVEDAFH